VILIEQLRDNFPHDEGKETFPLLRGKNLKTFGIPLTVSCSHTKNTYIHRLKLAQCNGSQHKSSFSLFLCGCIFQELNMIRRKKKRKSLCSSGDVKSWAIMQWCHLESSGPRKSRTG
jgi:hypothetical protein